MEALEIVQAWLEQYPGWSAEVDSVESTPGSWGIYPGGVTELSCREDVLGVRQLRLRQSFNLRLTAPCGKAAALQVQKLQSWVNSQTRMPALGSQCRVLAQAGRLVSSDKSAMGSYEIKLTCEYGKELTYGEDCAQVSGALH